MYSACVCVYVRALMCIKEYQNINQVSDKITNTDNRNINSLYSQRVVGIVVNVDIILEHFFCLFLCSVFE